MTSEPTSSAGVAGRAGRLLAVAVLAVLVICLPAAPASAATVTCPPMSSDVCKDLVPIAECYWKNTDGTTSFVWGWNNPTSDTASIAVGSNHNEITPANAQTQPSAFTPGRQQNAFFTVTAASSATWRLGNTSVAADNGVPGGAVTPKCATKPVPQVGSVTALVTLLFLLMLAALTWVAANTRPRHRPAVAR